MAHPSFHAQVLTPEGTGYDGEVEQVSTRTGVGEVGILAHHAPMLARLVPAELRLHVSDGETAVSPSGPSPPTNGRRGRRSATPRATAGSRSSRTAPGS